ncbi:cation:dicarboxylase symporter family transporter [Pseudohalioglobus sediminis]|uniref:Cation:dicarboxylase symporter family transporter n=1 Tax=Pseudohalioglobus sediminis TaxID=2606449 RepID=A0A5B0X0H6_9GAMM|nr:cation:dicarboxylase symporter family transporter [Pseudohalioglobus sediminis]
MSLSGRILVGLVVGILTGLFFGELVADLKVLGDIFVRLLQITVLPYIVASLISGIGRMSMAHARQLAVRGGLVLLFIWIMALVLIFTAALAFPSIDAASFFGSAAPVDPRQPNLYDLYLPANIFYSLSNNFVPAVVLFSILVGIALISIEEKDSILHFFDGIAKTMSRINNIVVQLTPYGIFAIAAAASGTMTIEELGRVQVYLVTYVCLAVLTTFWIFPGLISALSGIPFGEVFRTFRDPLVTAFATGNQFVVLPQIAASCKQLLARHGAGDEQTDSAVDILVPVSFNFPSLGKLLVLLFVLFAAWFTDVELDAANGFFLASAGLLSLFGSINVAVPYMLDALRIPSDMFQLFLVTGIVVGRFGAMLAALHIIVLSILGALAMSGRLRFSLRLFTRYLLLTFMGLVLMVAALRVYFELFVPPPPPREEVLANVELSSRWIPFEVSTTLPEITQTQLSGSRVDHILHSGILQVGYRPNNLPCSYITPRGELVGYDVEMAQALAVDLEVELEFVPFEYDDLGRMLAAGDIDVAMSCIASLPDRFAYATFSDPYLTLRLGFVMPDHERALFMDLDKLRAKTDLTIALVSSHYHEERLKHLLPNVSIVMLESAEDFFTGRSQGADAMVLTVEEGSAYAYRYPQYTVVGSSREIGIPASYPVPKGDLEMMQFMNNWIQLKRLDGTIDALYQYWMLGGAAKQKQPRWSVIRDVLGWVD